MLGLNSIMNLSNIQFVIERFLFNLFSFRNSIPGIYKYNPHSYCCEYDFYKNIKNFTYEPLFTDAQSSIVSKNIVGATFLTTECRDEMSSYLCSQAYLFIDKISTNILNICNNCCNPNSLLQFKDRSKLECFYFFLCKLDNLVCILVDGWVFPIVINPTNLEDQMNPAYNILWNFKVCMTLIKSGKYVINPYKVFDFDQIIQHSRNFKIIEIPWDNFLCSDVSSNKETKSIESVTEPYHNMKDEEYVNVLLIFVFKYLNHILIVVGFVCSAITSMRLINRRKDFSLIDEAKILSVGVVSLFILIAVLGLKI